MFYYNISANIIIKEKIMDVKKMIEMLTDNSLEEVLVKVKEIVEAGNAELISSTIKNYINAIDEYVEEERLEDDIVNGDLSYGLNLYKGICKLILALGKVLKVNNFLVLEEAYDIDDFLQGYMDDYKMYVESCLEDDESELEEMHSIYEEIKKVFDDADYDEY